MLATWGANQGFSPSSLFSAGEQGTWYDPSDLTTLFQDSAGTTPVTAVEQPVGKMLDKSGRGNHATQSTSANRPTLSARYNQFVGTGTLATQNVTTVATTYTLRFEGTGSITLSGTKTGTYTAGLNTLTGVTAGTLTITVSGSVTSADLRPENAGVGLPTYQSVTNSTTYDTVGFPYYIKFDGVDDFFVTNSIDFTATDKVSVFAGVRKLSDAARAMLLEFGTNAYTNIFSINSPVSAAPNFNFSSGGTVGSGTTYENALYGAPISAVVAGIGNISAPSATLRLNASQVSSSSSTQGTGNYGNYPLYIGRRGGSSLPFSGQLYSLIVRGAQSSSDQINATERYVNSKTKAY